MTAAGPEDAQIKVRVRIRIIVCILFCGWDGFGSIEGFGLAGLLGKGTDGLWEGSDFNRQTGSGCPGDEVEGERCGVFSDDKITGWRENGSERKSELDRAGELPVTEVHLHAIGVVKFDEFIAHRVDVVVVVNFIDHGCCARGTA